MAAKKLPWYSRYSGYRRVAGSSPRRTIRAAITAVILAAIALVILMVALYKTGHLTHLQPKVCDVPFSPLPLTQLPLLPSQNSGPAMSKVRLSVSSPEASSPLTQPLHDARPEADCWHVSALPVHQSFNGVFEDVLTNSKKETINVRTDQGTFVGEITPSSPLYPRSIQAFRGIPYAQSPTGENRFKPPQPLTDRKPNTEYRAVEFGFDCPQRSLRTPQDEDCLNLNLYRPHYSDDGPVKMADMAKIGGNDTKLPVVIYVHGGGFVAGTAKERNMASFVAWAETPMIGISFNYRIGALGFLPSGVAEKFGLMNLGLKDQQFLFRWVQKNVASFGGDPDNVSIMGLSAGAHSIGHQLISYAPANKLTQDPPPFQKAIMESGGALARAVFNPTHPLNEKQFKEFISKCGLEGVPDDELFAKLRALPAQKIFDAQNFLVGQYWSTLQWPFQPAIDGAGGVVPDLPRESWAKGNVMRIPIMTGFDTNEGAIFVPTQSSNMSALNNLMTSLVPALNETSIKLMDQLYPNINTTDGRSLYTVALPKGFGTQFWRLDDAYAHYAYICPVLQQASLASVSTPKTPVYVYHFAARSAAYGGADHGDEAPFVAHDMTIIKNYKGLNQTADAMNAYWTRFAAFGDPNPSSEQKLAGVTGNMTWTPFVDPFSQSTSEKGQVALFGQGNNERMGMVGRGNPGVPAQMTTMNDRQKAQCQFWWDRVIYSEGYGNGSLVHPAGIKAAGNKASNGKATLP
ncbi:hypothetical protein PG999_001948 [Apiospora kogelbergensis]|uniref:Carboxylesterase type B domain-containing protein n=1 Tax=Apiospora kogelbergensis TaxID=1337665 RepID=A0AAW0R712_9PEZI